MPLVNGRHRPRVSCHLSGWLPPSQWRTDCRAVTLGVEIGHPDPAVLRMKLGTKAERVWFAVRGSRRRQGRRVLVLFARRQDPAAHSFLLLRDPRGRQTEALGCPYETIKDILNHVENRSDVTTRYTRSDPLPRMREWLTKLGEHYHQLVERTDENCDHGQA